MDKSLLSDLSKAGIVPSVGRPADFGITVREYTAEKNCSEPVARRTLDAAVAAGVLAKHPMRTGMGGHSMVYYRPEEWPPKV